LIERFEASSFESGLAADNDLPYWYVFLADASQTHYLTLQRRQPFDDEEDWGVYVEVNDQGFSGYERISLCEVSGKAIRIMLTGPLGSHGQVQGIQVDFAPGRRPRRSSSSTFAPSSPAAKRSSELRVIRPRTKTRRVTGPAPREIIRPARPRV
jgi:hypothetical protein